jgi:hypothetical protein
MKSWAQIKRQAREAAKSNGDDPPLTLETAQALLWLYTKGGHKPIGGHVTVQRLRFFIAHSQEKAGRYESEKAKA